MFDGEFFGFVEIVILFVCLWNVVVIVNDCVDIVFVVGVDGVQVGVFDFLVVVVRFVVG